MSWTNIGNVEVPILKGLRDVRKVLGDVVAVSCVCAVLDFYLYHAAIVS